MWPPEVQTGIEAWGFTRLRNSEVETHVVSVACLGHRQKALQERQICLHVNVRTGASCGLNKHYSLTGNSSLEGIPDQRAPFEGLISQKESLSVVLWTVPPFQRDQPTRVPWSPSTSTEDRFSPQHSACLSLENYLYLPLLKAHLVLTSHSYKTNEIKN